MAQRILILALASIATASLLAPISASAAQQRLIERAAIAAPGAGPAALQPATFQGSGAAGAAIQRPGIGRPLLGGKPTQQFIAGLSAIVAAQIAAKEQADTGKINAFSKPRPRPDREQILFKRPSGPSFAR
ncbi:MAG: hypothetical protein WBA44_06770 [Mesorhizobium sp.]